MNDAEFGGVLVLAEGRVRDGPALFSFRTVMKGEDGLLRYAVYA